MLKIHIFNISSIFKYILKLGRVIMSDFLKKIFLDEKRQSMINFCQKELPADSDAYGDWIYLDGAQTALVEYQVN